MNTNTSSVAANLAAQGKPGALQTFSNGYALIVGVGQDLPFTVNDAVWLGKVLTSSEHCAYPRKQVKVLTGREATRGNVLDALSELSATVPSEAVFTFYFSGHGARIRSSRGSAYYLLPYSYDLSAPHETLIESEELLQHLHRIKSQNLVVLFNCCHAGGVLGPRSNAHSVLETQPDKDLFYSLKTRHGYIYLSATRGEQTAYAAKLDGQRPLSTFTAAVLESLYGKAAVSGDPYVRMPDVALYASRRVQELVTGLATRQEPDMDFAGESFSFGLYSGGPPHISGGPAGTNSNSSLAEVRVETTPGNFLRQHKFVRGVRMVTWLVTLMAALYFPLSFLGKHVWSTPLGIEIETTNGPGKGANMHFKTPQGELRGYVRYSLGLISEPVAPELEIFPCVNGWCEPRVPSKVDTNGSWVIPDVLLRHPAENTGDGQLQVILAKSLPSRNPPAYLYSKTISVIFPKPEITLESVCNYQVTTTTQQLPKCESLKLEGRARNLLWTRERVCVQIRTNAGQSPGMPATVSQSSRDTNSWTLYQGKPVAGDLGLKIGLDSVMTGDVCNPQSLLLDTILRFPAQAHSLKRRPYVNP